MSVAKSLTITLTFLFQYNITSCPDCRIEKSSLEEFFEEEILKPLDVEYLFRKRGLFDLNYELDFYIPEKNLGIEVNGVFWHAEKKKDFNHLQRKKLAFLEKKTNVLFFYEPIIYEKKDIISSILRAKIGKIERKFYVRKGKIKEIDYISASNFFEENHISGGSLPFSYAFGFFYDDELISVAAFSKPRYNKKFSWELIRFAHKKNSITIGFLSKVISIFGPKSLISYADLMVSDGRSYLSIGLKKIGITRPGYFYTKNGRHLLSREHFQKHKLKKLFEEGKIKFFDESKTEEENANMNGFYKVPTAGNFVFSY